MNAHLPPRIIAFTGHRSYNRTHDALLLGYVEGLVEDGAQTFRVGMAEGFDLAAALVVKSLKERYPHLRLELYIPFRQFHAHMNDVERRIYRTILQHATSICYIAEEYREGVFRERNEALVNGADLVVAWWNGRSSGTGYTVGYARKVGCRVKNLYHDQQLELEI